MSDWLDADDATRPPDDRDLFNRYYQLEPTLPERCRHHDTDGERCTEPDGHQRGRHRYARQTEPPAVGPCLCDECVENRERNARRVRLPGRPVF